MFYTSQRTIWKQDLELAQTFGLEYVVQPNTTLNEKLGINAQEKKPQGTYPLLRYFCIGCGGLSIVDKPTMYPYSSHQPIDASLFKMIPFILRPIDRDLTYAEKAKYRLRKEININGDTYVGYYLKAFRLDKDINYKEDFIQISQTISPFSLKDRDVLNPVPVTKVDKITSNNTTYITKLAKVSIELSEEELREIENVFTLLRDSLFTIENRSSKLTITEIGLCMGVDKVLDSGLTESIATQIAYHIGVNFDLDVYIKTHTEFHKTFELGGTEPLYME